jgi:hypothetical protein
MATREPRGLALSKKGMWCNSQNSVLLGKIILELMAGSVVISEVDTFLYVIISKAENTCLMGN